MIEEAPKKKKLHPRRRPSFKYIEWKILAYIIILMLFALTYTWQYEIEKVLNYRYYSGNEATTIQSFPNGETEDLKVHFIDVGCADATFIELPDNKTMLIDTAGENAYTQKSIDALMLYLETNVYRYKENNILDYLVITHPDRDHYMGAISIIKTYDVRNFIRPIVLSKEEKEFFSNDGVSNTFDNMEVKNVDSYNQTISYIKKDIQKDDTKNMLWCKAGLDLSNDCYTLKFITPQKISYGDSWNNYSPSIYLRYKDKSFLFMGDGEKEVEKEVCDYFLYDLGALNIDVLKVGHHGSNTSSSNLFLNATSPKYCIISTRVGVFQNVPSNDAIERIENETNAEIYRTDYNGNIIFGVSDKGNVGISVSYGSFAFVLKYIYVKLYYVLIPLSIIVYILIFNQHKFTRDERIMIELQKEYKQRQKIIKKMMRSKTNV